MEAQVIPQTYEEPPAPVADENAPPIVDDTPAPPPTGEKWTKTIHPRGRQARDPLAQTVAYQITNLETMKTLLDEYLAAPTCPPEHTTIEFTFPTSAAFSVYTADFLGTKDAHKARGSLFGQMNKTAISVVDALHQADPKEQMRKQKSVAKTIVEAIAATDGFRYSFHNNWLSKEDEACRFSYYCNDSTLNKGRAANEGAGMEGKKKVKPVYDCQGIIWVKFSITKNNLEVHYKHVPVHKTYEERAPPPRRDSRRRKLMELFTPEKLPNRWERKRKSEKDEPDKVRKRRATEPPRIEGDGTEVEEQRDESLAPLMDFLGSVDKEGAPGTDAEAVAALQNGQDPAAFPAERMAQLKERSIRTPKPPKEPKQPRPKKPSLPGMMSGYMAGDLITWGEKESRSSRNASAPQAPPLEPLADIADATAQADPNAAQGQMSELDMLKAKLAAAEAKINSLESDKSRPFGPPGWPPPGPPQPQPPQYNYPPPPPHGHYYTPQYQQGPPEPRQSHSPANASVTYGQPPAPAPAAGAAPATRSARGTPRKSRASGGA